MKKICKNQKTDDRKENLHYFGVESVLKSGATKNLKEVPLGHILRSKALQFHSILLTVMIK